QDKELAAHVDASAFYNARFDIDPASAIGELNGVAEQIHKSASDQFKISHNEREIMRDLFDEIYLLLNGERVYFGDGGLCDLTQTYGSEADVEGLTIELRHIEQIGHEPQDRLTTVDSGDYQIAYQLILDSASFKFERYGFEHSLNRGKRTF